jgi:hypothetical protein
MSRVGSAKVSSVHYSEPQQQINKDNQQSFDCDMNFNHSYNDKYKGITKSDLSTKLIGIPSSVFKVQEVSKLLLFAGVAVMGVIVIDSAVKMGMMISKRKS